MNAHRSRTTTPISEWMTTKLVTIPLDAPLSTARRLFARAEIHHLPVVSDGRLVGMLSSRDLLRAVHRATRDGGEASDADLDRSAEIADLMSRDLVMLRPDASVDEALELVADGAMHAVLVVDDDRQLVGIATDADLLSYFCE